MTCGTPIAGSLVHGQTFTVSGTGFGVRPDFNVDNYTWQGKRHIHFRFGDLAGGFPPNNSSEATFLAALKGFFPASFFAFNGDYISQNLSILDGGPSRSGKYIRKVGTRAADPGYLEVRTGSSSSIPDNPNAYTCYKHRGVGDGKIFRWRRSSTGTNFYMGATGAIRESEWPYDSGAFYGIPRSSTVWSRHELVINADGSKFRIDGGLISSRAFKDNVQSNLTLLPLVIASDSSRDLELTWPNSVDGGGAFEYADIYYDFTAARVEVWNAAGTIREIQLVTSWATDSIVCAFNKGELTSGQGTVKVFNASDIVIHSATATIA